MSVIESFRAVRPKRQLVKEVASCAYDVVNRREAKAIAGGNPNSFLHVVKAEIDLPDHIDGYDRIVYETARERFASMIEKGILFQDPEPHLYIYRQQMGDHVQNGIVARVSVREYESGKIKRHELTRSDKESDRTRHIDMVGAQTGPVFLTYRNRESIDAVVASETSKAPEYDFTADDGIIHTAWVIEDDRVVAEIKSQFREVEALYIADGHHRAASAATVARLRRERNPAENGTAPYNWIMAVLFPHNQLKILPYNRIVKDLGGMTFDGFMNAVAEHFHLSSPFENKSPEKPHEFGMYIKGRWYKLTMKDAPPPDAGIVESLDAMILYETVLKPVLAIGNIRDDARIDFVGGIRGAQELERLVDSGEYALAFTLYPTDMNQLMAISDAGLIMPPKSTWFEPKLRSGIFVHRLD